jgi:hypothetical protein
MRAAVGRPDGLRGMRFGVIRRWTSRPTPVVKCRVGRVIRRGHQKRIAVRGCPHHRLGADTAAGAWSVLNDELLTEALGKRPRVSRPPPAKSGGSFAINRKKYGGPMVICLVSPARLDRDLKAAEEFFELALELIICAGFT